MTLTTNHTNYTNKDRQTPGNDSDSTDETEIQPPFGLFHPIRVIRGQFPAISRLFLSDSCDSWSVSRFWGMRLICSRFHPTRSSVRIPSSPHDPRDENIDHGA